MVSLIKSCFGSSLQKEFVSFNENIKMASFQVKHKLNVSIFEDKLEIGKMLDRTVVYDIN
jgi:hypothetical protein